MHNTQMVIKYMYFIYKTIIKHPVLQDYNKYLYQGKEKYNSVLLLLGMTCALQFLKSRKPCKPGSKSHATSDWLAQTLKTWKARFDWRSNSGCIPLHSDKKIEIVYHLSSSFITSYNGMSLANRSMVIIADHTLHCWSILNVKAPTCHVQLVPCFAQAGYKCLQS